MRYITHFLHLKVHSVLYFQDNVSAEVSFHMARPATVLSNASGHSHASGAGPSPSSGERKLTRSSVSPVTNERAARRGNDQSEASVPAPSMNSEWTHLVDTATKAILDTEPTTAKEENIVNNNSTAQPTGEPDTDTPHVVTSSNSEAEPGSLLARLAALEAELRTERRERGELETEVDSLREENARLREESQTAAQQLRRLTEWFFQTIDKS